MNYGMPFKGSKNRIAEKVIRILPSGRILFDLFGGGGAITHCALLSGKWEKVVYNELDPVVFKGFKMAINGEFANENRWISREDFFKLKDSDPYVAICFSFGNDLKTYCYGRDIEEHKKMLHEIIYGMTPCERLTAYKRFIKTYRELYKKWTLESLERLDRSQSLEHLDRLQSLEYLDRLQSLHALDRLQSLHALDRLQSLHALDIYNLDYAEVEIPKGAIIYCDIPYLNTNTYNTAFDYSRFYDWALQQDNIFISSYEMPSEFECVATIPRRGNMSAVNKDGIKNEKIFTPI